MSAQSKKKSSKHEFALYVPGLTDLLGGRNAGSTLALSHPDVCHHMVRVLRMKSGQECTLFDRESAVVFELETLTKRSVDGVILEKTENQKLMPAITFYLPLIKKDSFETALYSLSELGVTTIQPIITQKTQRVWGGQKEFDRSCSILIAAAQQSKNFAFPDLQKPVLLQDSLALIHDNTQKIFFDPSGMSAGVTIESLQKNGADHLVLMIGPEGDLTQEEKELLHTNGFIFCALTPTVLRALQAVPVSVGLFRSLLKT